LGNQRTERRLAAILAADIAGYSRLMGRDEEGTLAALKHLRKTLIDPTIEKNHGRMVKTTGDGALVEFASAVDAVRCAVEIQRGMAEQNATIPDDRRIDFRIGINVGDIIFDEGDIYGDGVNIAARIEAVAMPGGICLSDNAYQQVKGKLAIEVVDLGEQQLKNIAQKVRAFAVQLDGVRRAPPPTEPERLSIAVLPFQNMSGDADQEYFADGMAEEILTALARCKSLFVIARNSSFTYKGKAVDVRQVGRELGVRYVLEGSVRRGGNRLRFTAQLIDAGTGAHIWADRFDGEMNDVFELQDRITENVVGAIEPSLLQAEIERLKSKPASNLSAHDLLLRAQQHEYEFTEQSLASAVRCLEQALEIDPNYAPALALYAICQSWRRVQGWMHNPDIEIARGVQMAARAVELARDDANVLSMAAYTDWQLTMDAGRAGELAHRSLVLNPNSALGLMIAGWIEAGNGDHAKAIELFQRAQRLNPRDPRGWFVVTGMAFAHLFAGQLETATSLARTALAQSPRSAITLRVLAAGLALSGRQAEAAEVARRLLAVHPGLTISALQARTLYLAPDISRRYAAALRQAGLPE